MKHLITFFISTLIVIPQVYSMQHIYWSEHEAQIFKQKKLQEEQLRQAKLRQAQQEQEEAQKREEEARKQEVFRQARIQEESRKQEALRQQELLTQQQLREVQRIEQEATVILELIRKEDEEEARKRIEEETRCLELVRQEEALQLVKIRQEARRAQEAQISQQLQALSLDEENLSQAMHALSVEDTPVPLVISAGNTSLPTTPPNSAELARAVALSKAAKPVPQPKDSEPVVSLALELVDGSVTITITPVGQSDAPAASDAKTEDLVGKKDAKLLGDGDDKELKKALALDDKTVQYITQCDWENLFRYTEEQLLDIFASLDVKQIDQPGVGTNLYPLHYAAVFGFVELVNTLVNSKKVNVNVINPETGVNALHLAMLINGDSDEIDAKCAYIADYLIKANIDVHCKKTENGATPLYYAVFKNRRRAIPILLTAGAHPNDLVGKNRKKQETPLDLAKKRHKKELLPLFEEFNKKKA